MGITAFKKVGEAKKKPMPVVKEVVKDPRNPAPADLTFRDEVALRALQAFITKFGIVSPLNVGNPTDTSYQLCRAAYLYADAFLDERARRSQT